MEHSVNWLIDRVRKTFPDFALQGQLKAKGEDVDDRWFLRIVDGRAEKQMIVPVGIVVECPHCRESFRVDAKTGKPPVDD
jgi:hypothetical protein